MNTRVHRRSLAAILFLLLGVLGVLVVSPSRGAGQSSGLPPINGGQERAWKGKWIWTAGEPSPRNSYTYFRKAFRLDRAPRAATLHLTADSRYQLFVNGEFAGRGPVRSDRRWLYYDSWDVAPLLHEGGNVIAVLVHHYGEWTFQYQRGRGGLIADLEADGQTPARTDNSWRALRSDAWSSAQPRMDIQLDFNEIYDARKAPEGWTGLRFDDGDWPPATEIGGAGMEPWPHLVARDIPPLHEEPLAALKVLEVAEVRPGSESGPFPQVAHEMATEARGPLRQAHVEAPDRILESGGKPARVTTAPGADLSFLIDFGKEVTGFPQIHLRGAHGGEVVDLGYGEVLQDERGAFIAPSSGRIGRLNPDRDNVHYADRYVCRAGEQRFRTFDRRAFRYLQVDVRSAPAGLELDEANILFSTYPVKYRGDFSCSDERLNRIWQIGRYTCQLNMEDAYTDCPWRERGQWWGDARVESLINDYAFGDTRLMRKALRQHAESLNEEGMTWGVYPTDWDGGRLPSFTLIWIASLWDTYQQTGDRALVADLFPRVRYTLDHFFAPKVSERGLLRNVPYWVFIDWAPVETDGESGALNAYYYDALRDAGAMARLLEDDSAAEYDRRADAVKAAMNARLWDPQARVYRDSIRPDGTLSTKISQQTNSLGVLFDIAPDERQAGILDYIYAPENKGKVVEAGSPYFSYYQLAALFHAGRRDQALAYIRDHWGRMLDWGATTWWEMWNPGASFCHGWSGGPTYNLEADILGVKPLKPGFAEVSIAPHWVGLQHAAGLVPTVNGDVQVTWERGGKVGTTTVRVETPAAMSAEVTLPTDDPVRVTRSGIRRGRSSGVSRLAAPPGSSRFRIEHGGVTTFEIIE